MKDLRAHAAAIAVIGLFAGYLFGLKALFWVTVVIVASAAISIIFIGIRISSSDGVSIGFMLMVVGFALSFLVPAWAMRLWLFRYLVV
jgi:hypothetical protein